MENDAINNLALQTLIAQIEVMNTDEKAEAINKVKEELKKISPFANEPVDCVQWVKEELVIAMMKRKREEDINQISLFDGG